MTNVQWKMMAPYSALPVLLLAMVLVHWDRLSGTELLMRLVFTAFGYQAALGDLREKRVPNRLVAAMASAWVVIVVPQLFLHTEQTLYLVFSGVTGFLLAGVVFLAVYLISRRGLGGGDVKLMAVCGLVLGWKLVLLAFFLGCILGSVIHIIRMKAFGADRVLAMGPYLSLGVLLAVLWGNTMIQWYMGLLGF